MSSCVLTFFTIYRPRSSGLVPNTNKHAVEANPVWMTDNAYNNMTFNGEDDPGNIAESILYKDFK